MIHRFFLSVAVLLATISVANAAPQMPSRASENAYAAIERFRAGDLPAVDVASLPAPAQKSAPFLDEHGRLRVAGVRALLKSAPVRDWVAIGEGQVNRLRATSQEAQGLRLRLNVGAIQAPLEIRAQGADGRVEAMRVEPGQGPEVWTPWTSGPTQVIELFAAHGAPVPAVQIEAVLHFDESPFAKAAASCTVPVACSTEDNTLDAAIAERKNSSARILFVENGGGFVCSATLINTERFPAGYLLTANHCVATTATAASVTTFWFYEGSTCEDPTLDPGRVQQAGGTQLVFTNHNADSTLLLGPAPPAGAVYAGWNAARALEGEPVVSISHPRGDTTRLATGAMSGMLRITDRAQDEYGVTFSRGIIEGGSSGSGIFSLSGTSLLLRGVLTGTTIRNGSGMSCTNLAEQAIYGRLEIFAPQMAQYLRASGPIADDTPNRVQDWASVAAEAVLNGRAANLDRRLEYVGDVDVFRFRLDAEANVSLSTQGTLDTVGTLMDANGKSIEANDDVTVGNLNFGITRTLQPGTYYVMVAPWEANGTGTYRLAMTATNTVSTPTPNPGSGNFTDLWWNSSEAGWGLNLSHQGEIIFATLYNYDAARNPVWFYMSNGDRQGDGSYQGTLYRASGPPFNASPWGTYNAIPVGTMRLTFTSGSEGQVVYSVNGVSVTKNITRYQFSTPTTCAWSTGDRVGALNYQDLWWNPGEAGWGVNIAHQGNAMFATLYTYDAFGQPLWLSMSNGTLVGVRTYQGTLYRSVGPPFNSSPWGNYSLQPVGTMTFAFSHGNSGTLTYTVNGVQVVKSITRLVYSTPGPLCSSP